MLEEPTLAQLERFTKSFQWSRAVAACRRALTTVPIDDLITRGSFLERVGLYEYHSAMQARTSEGFRRRIREAIASYKNAEKSFHDLGADGNGQLLRCLAMEACLYHWLAKEPGEKKRFLDNSWDLAKKSLRCFEGGKRDREYAETYIHLSVAAALGSELDWSVQSRVRTIEGAIECGRKSIGILRSIRDNEELAKALVKTSLFLDGLVDCISDQERIRKCQDEALGFWEEALKRSRDVALQEFCRPPQGFYRILDPPSSLSLSIEALKLVRPQRDNFAIGWVLDSLAKWMFYAAESTENEVRTVKMHGKALQLAEEAAERYKLINFTSPIIGVYWAQSPYAEYFLQLASHEADPEKRRRLLEKSHRESRELLRLAERSKHPQVITYSLHVSSRIASVLADGETNKRQKKELLREALKHRIHNYRVLDQIDPVLSWNRAACISNLAETQTKLADEEDNLRKRRRLLIDGSSNFEKGLKWGTAMVEGFQDPGKHVLNIQLGRFHREYGNLLLRLYATTNETRYLQRAAKEYSAAAECFRGVSRYKRQAESHWKSAETYDRLGAYSLAAENFALASRAYDALGKQVQPLRESSTEYALYMKAWKDIENARSNHFGLHHKTAAHRFNSAARLHKSTKRWSFLTPYYLAWSNLESGEDLSKNDRHKEAIKAFRRASRLFQDSRLLSKQRLAMLDQPDERAMVARLVNLPSEDYCHARIILDEAVLAQSREDYRASFEKFSLASEKLREFSKHSEPGEDRTEISFLSTLCEAWRLCDQAELEDSTKPLEEALKLFVKAKKMSLTESARKLASGHQAFCKGLIASRKFAETLDQRYHDEASRHLDLASGCYRDAGFRAASDHAMARKLLLDASVRLSDASNEKEQGKKAALYKLATGLLHESVQAFLRAQQLRKRDQTLGLLERARKESRIALHLAEMLKAASGAASNVAFHSLARGEEKAVGLERFERSDIEAKVTRITKELGLKPEIELDIEVLNLGERPISVVKVEPAPESEQFSSWDSAGHDGPALVYPRRIGPASIDTIKLMVRPELEGLVRLRPRVVFVDERGLRREKDLSPVILATSRIVEFLAESFRADYMDRHFAQANCGWRTMMDIVNSLKIPRSHVYGEPRYGRAFGRQLDVLVKSALVEYRIFQGERGRGGDITRVRLQVENENVKRYIEQLTSGQEKPSTLERAIVFRLEHQTTTPEIV